MDLFIETPQQAAQRSQRWERFETYQSVDSGSGRESVMASRAHAEEGAPDCCGARPSRAAAAASGDGAASQGPAGVSEPEPRALDLDEPEPYSIAGDAYQRELAYDTGRARRRRVGHVVRVLAYIVLAPAAVVAVFVAAYALTYVLQGATPEELLAALHGLLRRAEGVMAEWASMLPVG